MVNVAEKKKTRIGCKVLLLVLAGLILIAASATAFVNIYFPLKYTDIVFKYAEEYGLEPELVLAVIRAESRFNKDAVSSRGASGLMQIMESTAYWLAPQIGMDDFYYGQIFDPEINIRLGCFYLSMLIRRYSNIETALSAYNAGSGNVDSWLANPEHSSDGKALDFIPFPETRNYVDRVLRYQQIYTMLLRIRNT